MTDYQLPPSPDVASGKWETVPHEELAKDLAGTLEGWTFVGREHDEMTFPYVIIGTDPEGSQDAYVSVDLKHAVWRWRMGGSITR